MSCVHPRLQAAQWEPDNTLALCAGECHTWFDNHKKDAYPWFAAKFPDRAARLEMRIADRSLKPPMDKTAIRLWLEQEIAKLGGR